MTTDESIKIVKALAEGVDPFTYDPLPPTSPLQNPTYIRALFTALKGLEVLKIKESRQSSLPRNAGKPWTTEEDERLLVSHRQGLNLRALSVELGRSITAVRIRLGSLGVILDEQ
jgi:hypothetical protein